ncbi:hypothetical protein [Euzebya tangerina]|uniref:hypothetical protein n=1 Tax=Euzebya tangerina TaxID=591198 RepID=UPI000E31B6C9|nr:hypothetical protein [Euzebya tangerina]
MIGPVVVVPSTPLALPGHPGRTHPEIETLRGQIARAVAELAGQTHVLVVAGGPAGSGTRLRMPAGLDEEEGRLRRAYGLITRVTRTGDTSPGRGTQQGGVPDDGVIRDLTTAVRSELGPGELTSQSAEVNDVGWVDAQVLAAHAATAAPDAVTVLLSVASDVPWPVAARLGRVIGSLRTAGQLSVMVAGDLSAGHGPKPPRPGADTTLDEHVVAALDGGRPERLLTLDPEQAAASHARAVGALRVLGATLCTPTGTASMGTVVRWSGAPLGVGYVVAVGR